MSCCVRRSRIQIRPSRSTPNASTCRRSPPSRSGADESPPCRRRRSASPRRLRVRSCPYSNSPTMRPPMRRRVRCRTSNSESPDPGEFRRKKMPPGGVSRGASGSGGPGIRTLKGLRPAVFKTAALPIRSSPPKCNRDRKLTKIAWLDQPARRSLRFGPNAGGFARPRGSAPCRRSPDEKFGRLPDRRTNAVRLC